ncbi:MAG: WXG100 family type VII secretion target [Oscillospiraceae bacterium]
MAELRQVNPDEMNTQAQALDQIIGDWEDSVREITSLKQELDGMWDGLANDSFNERWENDLNKYNSLSLVMEDYRRAVVDAAKKYEQYEQEIKGIVEN